jgi:hypothetical protein
MALPKLQKEIQKVLAQFLQQPLPSMFDEKVIF